MAKSKNKAIGMLMDYCGYGPDDLDLYISDALGADEIPPAICMNDDCEYIAHMEPDQNRGYCEECKTNSMKSLYILAGLI